MVVVVVVRVVVPCCRVLLSRRREETKKSGVVRTIGTAITVRCVLPPFLLHSCTLVRVLLSVCCCYDSGGAQCRCYGVIVVVTATRVKRTAARKRARVRVHARFSHRLFRRWYVFTTGDVVYVRCTLVIHGETSGCALSVHGVCRHGRGWMTIIALYVLFR